MAITEDGRVVIDDISEEGRIVLDGTLLENGRIIILSGVEKESSIGISVEETKTKTSSIGINVEETKTKASLIGLRILNRNTKASLIGVSIQETKTKTSSVGVDVQESYTKGSSIGVNISEPLPYEDFTTFTEVDVGADRIQKTAYHVDHYACTNETTYLYKNYGVDKFSDFTHKIKARFVSGDSRAHAVIWMLANDLGNAYALDIAGKSFIYLEFYKDFTNTLYFHLVEIYNGTLYKSDNTIAAGLWRYIKIVKSGTSLYAYVYSDSNYSVLVDTRNLTLHEDGSYKYLYGCNTYADGTSYCATVDVENLNLNAVRKVSSIGISVVNRNTKASLIGVSIQETKTKTSSVGMRVVEHQTKASSIGLLVSGASIHASSIGMSIKIEKVHVSVLGITTSKRFIKESSIGMSVAGINSKESSIGISINETNTKASLIGVSIQETKTKTSSVGMRVVEHQTKASSITVTIKATYTKNSYIGLNVLVSKTKESSIGISVDGYNTKESSIGVSIFEPGLKKGLFYAKLGDTILEAIVPESFRISEEINKIPSFEFEVANSEVNRTAIAANPTALLKIYWQHHGMENHIFTGIINADGVEYVSLTNIRITGFSSYAKLGWPIFKHLSSEDAEQVNTVFGFCGTYTDYTTQANNANINDVLVAFSGANHCLYVGEANPFWGLQIKYSTKGVSGNAVTIIEYSKGGGIWAELNVLDETYAFTEAAGTYDFIIAHPPSDWARNTIDGVSKFWLRWRVVSGAYTTSPKLDQIHTVNVDVYRVFYLATSARTILLDALEDTEYSMDTTDACPEDVINLFAQYESPLRVIAAVPAALTWTDIDGSKKSYQWWIDDVKKVHIKKKRGTTYLDDITGDLTIFNNLLDYFNLSNRLIGFGKRDGLSQIRAIVEDRASQTTHTLRELAVSKTNVGKYITLKESLEKDIAISKEPMQRIKGSVTTEFWEHRGYEVGDTVTLHQGEWVVEEGKFQIVKVDKGPILTQLNLGISQEHLEGLKSNLKRSFDISNVQMHGSTSLLTAGPETSNYERKSDGSVFSAKLKIEIPSEVAKTHKVLLSWTIGPYRASVNEQTGSVPGHDHGGFGGMGGATAGGFAGSGGAFTPAVLDGGDFTPAMLSEAHQHDLSDTLTIDFGEIIINSVANEGVIEGLDHRHTTPSLWTGGPDDVADAWTSIYAGTSCTSGYCVAGGEVDAFALESHWHPISASVTGNTSPPGHIENHPISVVFTIHPYALQSTSLVESPAHLHDGIYELPHDHTGVAEGPHNDHTIPAEAGHSDHLIVVEPGTGIDIDFGIHEEAAGTVLELLVNGEKIGEYSGAQTEIRIDGYLSTGTNTIEIQPIAIETGKKGGATILGSGILFVEPKKF